MLAQFVKVEKLIMEMEEREGLLHHQKKLIPPLSTKRLTWTTLMTAIRDNGKVARIRRQEPKMRMRDTIPGT